MRFTRIRDLAALLVAAGAAAYILVRAYYGSLPRLQWFVPVSLPVLAVAEAVFGFQLRSRIGRRPGTVPVDPLVAARAVVLAKASAIVGAVVAGVWAGLLGYLLPVRDTITAAADDTPTGIVGCAGALCLVAAALWLEHCCRAPRPPDREDSPDTERASRG